MILEEIIEVFEQVVGKNLVVHRSIVDCPNIKCFKKYTISIIEVKKDNTIETSTTASETYKAADISQEEIASRIELKLIKELFTLVKNGFFEDKTKQISDSLN